MQSQNPESLNVSMAIASELVFILFLNLIFQKLTSYLTEALDSHNAAIVKIDLCLRLYLEENYTFPSIPIQSYGYCLDFQCYSIY